MTPSGDEWTRDAAAAEEPPMDALLLCWRCGLASVPVRGRCPHCRARLTDESRSSAPTLGMSPIFKVIIGFTVLLAISLVWGWVAHFGNIGPKGAVAGTIALGIIDALLTLALWAWIGRLVQQPVSLRSLGFTAYSGPTMTQPIPGLLPLSWVLAWPALVGVLAFNLGFNYALQQFLKVPDWMKPPPLFEGLTLTNILLIAVQPAIVEELFFRHLVLGAIRQTSGIHAAVWVSALMFALAHVYAPLGLPWLVVAGVVFGYARVCGGLLLPMLLHGTHNFIILWLVGGV